MSDKSKLRHEAWLNRGNSNDAEGCVGLSETERVLLRNLAGLAEAIAAEVERIDREAAQHKQSQQEIRRNEFKIISGRLDKLEQRLLLAETGQMVTDAIVDVRTGNQRLPGWCSGTESD